MKRYRLAFALIPFGLLCNILVVAVNGGVMPVIGGPESMTGVGLNLYANYERANETHRLLALADRWAWGGFSPGDLLMIGGLVAMIVALKWRRVRA